MSSLKPFNFCLNVFFTAGNLPIGNLYLGMVQKLVTLYIHICVIIRLPVFMQKRILICTILHITYVSHIMLQLVKMQISLSNRIWL